MRVSISLAAELTNSQCPWAGRSSSERSHTGGAMGRSCGFLPKRSAINARNVDRSCSEGPDSADTAVVPWMWIDAVVSAWGLNITSSQVENHGPRPLEAATVAAGQPEIEMPRLCVIARMDRLGQALLRSQGLCQVASLSF